MKRNIAACSSARSRRCCNSIACPGHSRRCSNAKTCTPPGQRQRLPVAGDQCVDPHKVPRQRRIYHRRRAHSAQRDLRLQSAAVRFRLKAHHAPSGNQAKARRIGVHGKSRAGELTKSWSNGVWSDGRVRIIPTLLRHCLLPSSSSFHTHHLLQRMHDLDQILLRIHHIVDGLVGHRRFVDHVGVFAAFDAGRRFDMVVET